MRFGYTIIYVTDVKASMRFFEAAFDLTQRFYHDSGYGEMETGQTALAFASHDLGRSNLPDGYIHADQSAIPLGIEIALVTDDVNAAQDKAVKAGAASLKQPMVKSWGQTVSYVRCPDGTLVELCSPIAA